MGMHVYTQQGIHRNTPIYTPTYLKTQGLLSVPEYAEMLSANTWYLIAQHIVWHNTTPYTVHPIPSTLTLRISVLIPNLLSTLILMKPLV